MKARYKFQGESDGWYYWTRPAPDFAPGFEEQVTCRVEWFWDLSRSMCGSRGPRIGDDGKPVCKRPKGHEGHHKPAPSDGWGPGMIWGDPW